MGHQLFDLTDKVVIVTGGASGIGRTYCEALAFCGAIPVIADQNEMLAQQVASDLNASGRSALGLGCDVSNSDSVQGMVAAVIKQEFWVCTRSCEQCCSYEHTTPWPMV